MITVFASQFLQQISITRLTSAIRSSPFFCGFPKIFSQLPMRIIPRMMIQRLSQYIHILHQHSEWKSPDEKGKQL